MAEENKQQAGGKKDMASWKPGSEPEEAKNVGSPGDFGVPAGKGRSRDRDYTSANTKQSDPGNAQPLSSEFDALRTSGAGSHHSGDGSGSAGDIDTDVLGVGTGGSGIAESGPGEPPGPDDATGTSADAASGPPAKGENQGKIKGGEAVKGTTINSDLDKQAGQPGEGADAASNPAREDDAFAGEVSSDEASGREGE